MEMMIIADPHLGLKSGIENKDRGSVSLSKFFFDETTGFLDQAIEAHPHINTLMFVGDTFEKQTFMDILVKKETEDWIAKHKDKILIFLLGNHDTYYRNTNYYNSVEYLMDMFSHVHVIKGAFEYIDNGNILCMNWINKENMEESLAELERATCKYVFGHFDIIGGLQQPTTKSTKGFEPSLFEKFDRVFSGHYHIQSEIENIVYVGNPTHTTFADVGQPKGVIIFNSDSGEYRRYNNDNMLFHEVYMADGNINTDDYVGKIVKFVIDLSHPTYDREEHKRIVTELRSKVVDLKVVSMRSNTLDIKKPDDISIEAVTHKQHLDVIMENNDFDDVTKAYIGELYIKSKEKMNVEVE